jgi:photosystem II stability/assembly factor-like uncharacterized protein
VAECEWQLAHLTSRAVIVNCDESSGGIAVLNGAKLRVFFVCLVFLFAATLANAEQWVALGPDGGDARSITYDPTNPDRIYLGTSAGEMFLSNDGGNTWSRFAHFGTGYDYVLDSVAVDPKDPNIIYVGAWSVENDGGDVYKSTDRGKTWRALPGIHRESVRALALAPSDPNAIAVGALDGVHRSLDGGETWEKITPANQAELKNFESIAFDPTSVNIVYAGTWHLPWKTDDGGRTWQNIKQGIIDDSDVFSIIVDPKHPSVVYASACSGIYKSDSAGEQFKKVQGIPSSARRTRVLQQDPANSAVVYAGTTEGLWRTQDAGTTWTRIGPANLVVNDVMVDPRNSQVVYVATDRTGVLISRDGGNTFMASNRGFSHRQVTTVVADKDDANRLYAAMVNNREFGGIFMSSNGGTNWAPIIAGLGTRDIFSLDQTDSGALVAGTNQGLFTLERNSATWKPISTTLSERIKIVPVRVRKKGGPKTVEHREWVKGEISGRVAEVKAGETQWFAATTQGLYRSLDEGRSWTGGPVLGHKEFVGVDATDKKVLAASPDAVMLSEDGGNTWSELKLPNYVSRVNAVTIGPNSELWIVTHMGAFRTKDAGASWEHSMLGQPVSNLTYVAYDRPNSRLLAVAGGKKEVFESRDGGDTWTLAASSHWPIRNIAVSNGRMLAVTDFNGVLAQTEPEAVSKAAGGGN